MDRIHNSTGSVYGFYHPSRMTFVREETSSDNLAQLFEVGAEVMIEHGEQTIEARVTHASESEVMVEVPLSGKQVQNG